MTNQTKKRRSGTVAHIVRTADGRYTRLELTRRLAMAAHCTECMGFEANPADCTSKNCSMYPFRAKTLETKKGTMDKTEVTI